MEEMIAPCVCQTCAAYEQCDRSILLFNRDFKAHRVIAKCPNSDYLVDLWNTRGYAHVLDFDNISLLKWNMFFARVKK